MCPGTSPATPPKAQSAAVCAHRTLRQKGLARAFSEAFLAGERLTLSGPTEGASRALVAERSANLSGKADRGGRSGATQVAPG